MSDYRSSVPIVIPPPAKELKGDGVPMYADKWPQFVELTHHGAALTWPNEDKSNG